MVGERNNADEFYLSEDTSEIKDTFVWMLNEVPKEFAGEIADVGAATGAFCNYLKKQRPNAQITGIEYLKILREKAIEKFANIPFIYGNVEEKNSVKKKFDIITMAGVLGIFDEYDKVLANVIHWLKPNGKIILHSMISEYDIDVYVKYSRSAKVFDEKNVETGWNILSKKSLALAAQNCGAILTDVKTFEISKDLEKKKNDPLRSWTELSNNKRSIFNGLHLRQPQCIAIIKKN